MKEKKVKKIFELRFVAQEHIFLHMTMGFHLFEMLKLNNGIAIEFYIITRDSFILKEMVDIENCEFYFHPKYNNINYLITHGKVSNLQLLKIFDQNNLDQMSQISYMVFDEGKTINCNLLSNMQYEKLLEEGQLKAYGIIDHDSVDILYNLEYYKQNKEFIENVFSEFEKIYGHFIEKVKREPYE